MTSAQPPNIRYQLGESLRRLENALESAASDELRSRAGESMKIAVQRFFSMRISDALRHIDAAWISMLPDHLDRAVVESLAALHISPERRLIDETTAAVPLSIQAAYRTAEEIPLPYDLYLTITSEGGEPLAAYEWEINSEIWRVDLPTTELPPKDVMVVAMARRGDVEVPIGQFVLSKVECLEGRLSALQARIADGDATTGATEMATARMLLPLLRGLADGQTMETDYPAARLLADLEASLETAEDLYYGHWRPGEFWLNLVQDRRQFPMRVLVPPREGNGKVTCVIALHGAGGSENLFFDGYGNGKITRLCAERGWLLVAPRLSMMGSGFSIEALVGALRKTFDIDADRVVLVGHSMGGGAVLQAVAQGGIPVAAAAVIGGGRPIAVTDRVRQTPWFVAVGGEDFALAGASALAQRLKSNDVAVEYRMYPSVDHMTIVQRSLDDLFQWLDQHLAAHPAK